MSTLTTLLGSSLLLTRVLASLSRTTRRQAKAHYPHHLPPSSLTLSPSSHRSSPHINKTTDRDPMFSRNTNSSSIPFHLTLQISLSMGLIKHTMRQPFIRSKLLLNSRGPLQSINLNLSQKLSSTLTLQILSQVLLTCQRHKRRRASP